VELQPRGTSRAPAPPPELAQPSQPSQPSQRARHVAEDMREPAPILPARPPSGQRVVPQYHMSSEREPARDSDGRPAADAPDEESRRQERRRRERVQTMLRELEVRSNNPHLRSMQAGPTPPPRVAPRPLSLRAGPEPAPPGVARSGSAHALHTLLEPRLSQEELNSTPKGKPVTPSKHSQDVDAAPRPASRLTLARRSLENSPEAAEAAGLKQCNSSDDDAADAPSALGAAARAPGGDTFASSMRHRMSIVRETIDQSAMIKSLRKSLSVEDEDSDATLSSDNED
jgi:hypothetical protein